MFYVRGVPCPVVITTGERQIINFYDFIPHRISYSFAFYFSIIVGVVVVVVIWNSGDGGGSRGS